MDPPAPPSAPPLAATPALEELTLVRAFEPRPFGRSELGWRGVDDTGGESGSYPSKPSASASSESSFLLRRRRSVPQSSFMRHMTKKKGVSRT